MSHSTQDVNINIPNAARMYDYYLGGTHNFAVDREFGKKVESTWPHITAVARNNRSFLRRVILQAINSGIRQFIDIGSGVPTVGNVHEIALNGHDSRVVYVDYEPVAYTVSRSTISDQGIENQVSAIQENLHNADDIFDHPEMNRLIDFDQPICLLMVAIIHFIDHDSSDNLLANYQDRLPKGSWFAASHIACDQAPPEEQKLVYDFASEYQNTSNPLYVRSKEEFSSFFERFNILEPGISFLPDWRPEDSERVDPPASRPLAWCGVGEKL